MSSYLKKIYALAEMFPAGQKTNAAVLEYSVPISAAQISADSFLVEGRRITGAFVNDAPEKPEQGKDGCFVILTLSVAGKEGDVVVDGERKKPGPPPPKTRITPSARVCQCSEITAADGSVLPPFDATDSVESIEPVVDRFVIDSYDGLKYNLFIPEKHENESYPLVLFIADLGANGLYDRMALSQGIGGTVWASPEEQQKRPCFVLVPQFPFMQVMRDDFTFDPVFEKIKPLLDHICETQPVDRTRIYATGQSQGCMAACELNCEYPELFAASLLVAGQWDPDKMAERCIGQKYWIMVSEADEKASGGMEAIASAMEKKGARIVRLDMDAKATPAQWNDDVRYALQTEADIYFTTFSGDSVIPEWDDGPFRLHHAHSWTWPTAYQVAAVREWLFGNHREGTENGK